MHYTEEFIVKAYLAGKSPYEISEELGAAWNHMRVRKVLRKAGIILRNKSEAQRNALQSGRSIHPKKKENKNDGN